MARKVVRSCAVMEGLDLSSIVKPNVNLFVVSSISVCLRIWLFFHLVSLLVRGFGTLGRLRHKNSCPLPLQDDDGFLPHLSHLFQLLEVSGCRLSCSCSRWPCTGVPLVWNVAEWSLNSSADRNFVWIQLFAVFERYRGWFPPPTSQITSKFFTLLFWLKGKRARWGEQHSDSSISLISRELSIRDGGEPTERCHRSAALCEQCNRGHLPPPLCPDNRRVPGESFAHLVPVMSDHTIPSLPYRPFGLRKRFC